MRKTLGLRFEGETRELDKIVVGDIVVKPPWVALDVSVVLWAWVGWTAKSRYGRSGTAGAILRASCESELTSSEMVMLG